MTRTNVIFSIKDISFSFIAAAIGYLVVVILYGLGNVKSFSTVLEHLFSGWLGIFLGFLSGKDFFPFTFQIIVTVAVNYLFRKFGAPKIGENIPKLLVSSFFGIVIFYFSLLVVMIIYSVLIQLCIGYRDDGSLMFNCSSKNVIS